MAEQGDERTLKWWGWGYDDQQPDRAGLEAVAKGVHERLGFEPSGVVEAVNLEDLDLPPSRLTPTPTLSDLFSDSPRDRASHAVGRAYRDIVRTIRGDLPNPPDLVARPGSPEEVDAVLGWCEDSNAAVIPFGGGTSVVGGVEARLPEDSDHAGVVSLDLKRLDRVLEVDPVSLAARIEGGATGPGLEGQLREHGLTLRHYPQSFEFSTLGGWIATRAGGHFATGETHIDDLVESARMITPSGEWLSRRLPGSGAGPSPDRMVIGSEGTLGVIVDAWMRVRERPRWRANCSVLFEDFFDGAAAVRALAQSGLQPANCRLLDATEAEINGVSADGSLVLVIGFESARVPVVERLDQAVEIARDCGGSPGSIESRDAEDRAEGRPGEASASADWRNAFLAAPYLRDALICSGVLTETFETAITWDRFDEFTRSVLEEARRVTAELSDAPVEGPGSPSVSCRITHAYSDGAAPYFTVLAPSRPGAEVAQWDEIKRAVSEVLDSAGATITHHHAVGRDHREWYDRQRPKPFADALIAAKRALDPHGLMNPGVLVDPGGH